MQLAWRTTMLTVTQAASEHLAEMLDGANAPDEVAVRFVVEGNDLILRLDTARPGDATFDHEGRTVLLLEDGVSGLLDDSKLDVEDSDAGRKLTLQ
jgi:Fe-S cluster assembly iron-binding protein IscA